MDELLQRGIQLFNSREFFQCHEAPEEVWTVEAGSRRLFLKSLIHLAVCFYHGDSTNPAGASSQLQKGLCKLALYLRPARASMRRGCIGKHLRHLSKSAAGS